MGSPGTPDEKPGRLFEPFFITKPRGMGMPVSQTIIDAHWQPAPP
jgi:signal transduction histidine kinase